MNKNNINQDDDETYTALDATKIGKDELNYEALTLPGARKVSFRKCRYTSSKSGIRSGKAVLDMILLTNGGFFRIQKVFDENTNFSALFDTHSQLLIIPFFAANLVHLPLNVFELSDCMKNSGAENMHVPLPQGPQVYQVLMLGKQIIFTQWFLF